MKTAYYIQNKKEGKFINKYLEIYDKPFESGYIIKHNNDRYEWSLGLPDDVSNVISVKTLIENNKSKLEKRISKLERKVNGLVDTYSGNINNSICLDPWDIINDLPALSKKELTELPEKWCVKVNEDNIDILKSYWLKLPKVDSSYNFQDWLISDKRSYNSYLIYNKDSLTAWGYTEISFSDFERLVLKKELLEKAEVLEIGKWYKGDVENDIAIYCITKIDDNECFSAYGVNFKGDWVNNKIAFGRLDCPNMRLATKKEVEEALKNEAAKRGFKKGINIKTPNGIEGTCKNGVLRYDRILNYLFIDEYACFVEGKWAEIVDPKEIDWSIPGQIVKGEYTTAITTGKHKNSLFEGFVISVTDGSDVNHLCKTLIKKYFSLVEGEIILKNNS